MAHRAISFRSTKRCVYSPVPPTATHLADTCTVEVSQHESTSSASDTYNAQYSDATDSDEEHSPALTHQRTSSSLCKYKHISCICIASLLIVAVLVILMISATNKLTSTSPETETGGSPLEFTPIGNRRYSEWFGSKQGELLNATQQGRIDYIEWSADDRFLTYLAFDSEQQSVFDIAGWIDQNTTNANDSCLPLQLSSDDDFIIGFRVKYRDAVHALTFYANSGRNYSCVADGVYDTNEWRDSGSHYLYDYFLSGLAIYSDDVVYAIAFEFTHTDYLQSSATAPPAATQATISTTKGGAWKPNKGIVVGGVCVVIVLLLCCLVCIACRRWKRSGKKKKNGVSKVLAVVIGIGRYGEEDADLPVHVDTEKLCRLFAAYNYSILQAPQRDDEYEWTADDLIRYFENEVCGELRSHDYEALLVYVTSHGIDQSILTSDLCLVEKRVLHRIVSKQLQSDIYRIFIFDCCAKIGIGNQHELQWRQIKLSDLPQLRPSQRGRNLDDRLIQIHAANDGYIANMHRENGSFLVNEFVDKMKENRRTPVCLRKICEQIEGGLQNRDTNQQKITNIFPVETKKLILVPRSVTSSKCCRCCLR